VKRDEQSRSPQDMKKPPEGGLFDEKRVSRPMTGETSDFPRRTAIE
jgi:hypothetical protein